MADTEGRRATRPDSVQLNALQSDARRRAAADTIGYDPPAFDLARIQLTYGSHLRRSKRTADARRHLTGAAGIFHRGRGNGKAGVRARPAAADRRSPAPTIWRVPLCTFVNNSSTVTSTGFKAVCSCHFIRTEVHYSRCHETAEQ